MPEPAWHMSKRQIAVLIATVWQHAGCVVCGETATVGRVALGGERGLLDDLARLLLRFGISTQIESSDADSVLVVGEPDDQRRFLQEIAPHVELGNGVATLLGQLRGSSSDLAARPVLSEPAPLWQEVGRVLSAEEVPHALGTIVDVLDGEDLDLYAVNDVLWDAVVDVELVGVEEVYDATVLGGHNFVANGVAVHNSIEQDADVVILLHRESMYERESPREGEADVIVAKHRNGPTDTIVVAFQGHYSRFTNMAQNF